MTVSRRRFALLAASAALSALCLEGALRALGLDRRIVARALYYQLADPPVHRASADRFLHYELRPSASHRSCDAHGCGPVTINRHGARGDAHDVARTPATFRVLCVGGSTTYGAGVGDAQTMPAALERALARDAPADRSVETWNLGTSAYTLAQAAHLARAKLDALRPDVVVVQLYNHGRRAFLPWSTGDDVVAWFDLDPELVPENFPPPPRVTLRAHRRAMRSLALYRVAHALWRQTEPPDASTYGDALSRREAAALSASAAARGVAVVYVAIPALRGSVAAGDVFPALDPSRFVDLYAPGREDLYYEVHPPAPYLAEYAERVAAALHTLGLAPTRDGPYRNGGATSGGGTIHSPSSSASASSSGTAQ